MKTTKMLSSIIMIFILLILLTFTACTMDIPGDETGTEAESPTPASTEQGVQDVTVVFDDTTAHITFSSITVKADAIIFSWDAVDDASLSDWFLICSDGTTKKTSVIDSTVKTCAFSSLSAVRPSAAGAL